MPLVRPHSGGLEREELMRRYVCTSSPHYHQATDVLDHEHHALIAETSKTTIATRMLSVKAVNAAWKAGTGLA